MILDPPERAGTEGAVSPIKTDVPRWLVLRELLLATTTGVVITVSPFTPNELAPSVAAGFAAAAALLAWRLRRDSPVWSEAAPDLRYAREHLLAIATLAICVAAFAPTVRWMYLEWTSSVWVNQHGLFVPFAMAWLVVRRLRLEHSPAEPSAWGFLPLAAGLSLSVLDANAQSRYAGGAGLLLVLVGLSMLLLGARRTWAIRGALCLGLLLMPVPFTVATPLGLRTITASSVAPLLSLLGYTVFREGTLLHIPPAQNFIVADACSGVNTLWAALAMALFLAAGARSNLRRFALLVGAPLLAVAANVVRVTLLVLLTTWFGQGLLDTPIHEATGVATFFGVLGPLMLIARVRRAEPER
jgi:exosortase